MADTRTRTPKRTPEQPQSPGGEAALDSACVRAKPYTFTWRLARFYVCDSAVNALRHTSVHVCVCVIITTNAPATMRGRCYSARRCVCEYSQHDTLYEACNLHYICQHSPAACTHPINVAQMKSVYYEYSTVWCHRTIPKECSLCTNSFPSGRRPYGLHSLNVI